LKFGQGNKVDQLASRIVAELYGVVVPGAMDETQPVIRIIFFEALKADAVRPADNAVVVVIGKRYTRVESV
jgi:hypothetical protein